MQAIRNRLSQVNAGLKHKGVRLSVVAGSALVALSAKADPAAIDITAATAGVTAASTAVLGVIAAMTTMAVGIWAVKKVLRLFGR